MKRITKYMLVALLLLVTALTGSVAFAYSPPQAQPTPVRFATFNVSLTRGSAGR